MNYEGNREWVAKLEFQKSSSDVKLEKRFVLRIMIRVRWSSTTHFNQKTIFVSEVAQTYIPIHPLGFVKRTSTSRKDMVFVELNTESK